jgi:DNA-directed RNA polymerase subunit H (RpoH/RPB5)
MHKTYIDHGQAKDDNVAVHKGPQHCSTSESQILSGKKSHATHIPVIYHQTAPSDEGNNLYKMEIEPGELPWICLDDKLCQFMVGEQCHFKRPKRL